MWSVRWQWCPRPWPVGCGVCDESEPEIRDPLNEPVELGVWSWIMAIVFLVPGPRAVVCVASLSQEIQDL